MQRYFAFLRAINVGGHTVKMDRLRGLFEELGYADVATFIASGNVTFEGPAGKEKKLVGQIEKQLRDALGYDVATIIRSGPELAAMTAYQPFPAEVLATPGSSLYVALLHEPASDEARQGLKKLRTEVDDFHCHEREVYWFCRTRLSDSPLFSGNKFEKTIAVPTTMRNMTTIRKLAAKFIP